MTTPTDTAFALIPNTLRAYLTFIPDLYALLSGPQHPFGGPELPAPEVTS